MAANLCRSVPTKNFLCAFFCVTALGQALDTSADQITAESRVVAVTVYQGQALVTREVDLPAGGGLLELVVGDLPDQIVPGSLYAEPGGEVEVRSVRYRLRPVQEDTREEVQQLDAEIQEITDEITSLTKRSMLLESRSKYLNSLEQFTSGTASSELEHGVLNAETLEHLTELIFKHRAEIADEELNVVRQKRELDEQLSLARRKRDKITNSSSRTLREAIVFLNVPEGEGSALRLTYLVSGASWTPSYNLRADEDRTRVVVEYNASVQQMSGEDWEDVEMTLSTASPSLVATAPKLDPLMIRLASISSSKGRQEERSKLFRRQKMLAESRGSINQSGPSSGLSMEDGAFGDDASELFGEGGFGGGFAAIYEPLANAARADVSLNALACELQISDFNTDASSLRKSRLERSMQPSEGLCVVYRLENRTSLPSRSDRQLIQIASMPIEAEFYRVASPVLTNYVYEEALITNGADLVLLAGPAATFLGERFVGRGQVPSVSIGESFTVGLGIDESLRVDRELVDKRDRIQGGNRVVEFDYRLTIDNFGDEPADVRLFDRLPSSKGSDIKVQLVKSNPPVSDTEADADRRKQGILRWDITVDPNANGTDSAEVTYTLQIEHDKNLSIVGLPVKQ